MLLCMNSTSSSNTPRSGPSDSSKISVPSFLQSKAGGCPAPPNVKQLVLQFRIPYDAVAKRARSPLRCSNAVFNLSSMSLGCVNAPENGSNLFAESVRVSIIASIAAEMP